MLSAIRLPPVNAVRRCRLSGSIPESLLRRTIRGAAGKDGGVSRLEAGTGRTPLINFTPRMQSELKGLGEPMVVDTAGLTDMARQMLEEDPDMQALLKSYQEAMLRVDRQAPQLAHAPHGEGEQCRVIPVLT